MIFQKLNSENKLLLSQYGITAGEYDSITYVTFSAGDIIFREGTAMNFFFLIVSGSAKIYTTSFDGNTLLFAHPIEKGFLGDTELFLQKKVALSTAIAYTDITCFQIPFSLFYYSLQKNPVFLFLLCENLSHKLLASIECLRLRTLHSAKEKICFYILRHHTNGYFLEILTEVADFLSISYRHFLRILSQLCKENILEKRPSGYKIINFEELKKRTHMY